MDLLNTLEEFSFTICPSFISLVHDFPGYMATVNYPGIGYMDYRNNELVKKLFLVWVTRRLMPAFKKHNLIEVNKISFKR